MKLKDKLSNGKVGKVRWDYLVVVPVCSEPVSAIIRCLQGIYREIITYFEGKSLLKPEISFKYSLLQ